MAPLISAVSKAQLVTLVDMTRRKDVGFDERNEVGSSPTIGATLRQIGTTAWKDRHYLHKKIKNMEKSIGEFRVRTEFNASGSSIVDMIKKKTAELINDCEELKTQGKDARLVSLAQTAFEEAAMWAVKSATS